MIERVVRIGTLADQDSFRREDVLCMTPDERLRCLIRLRDRQFRHIATPVRQSGSVQIRRLGSSPQVSGV